MEEKRITTCDGSLCVGIERCSHYNDWDYCPLSVVEQLKEEVNK